MGGAPFVVLTQPLKAGAGASAFRRVGLLAILILTFLLTLLSYLNYANFEKTYLGLIDSRSAVLAQDLAQAVEYGLNLGLRLDQMRQLNKLVAETQAGDPDILWVTVADAQDKPIFTSLPEATARMGLRVAALAKPHTKSEDGESYYTQVRLTNSFGRDSGSVVIARSRAAVNAKLGRVAKEMVQQTLAVLGLFAIPIVLVTFVQARGFDRYEVNLRRLLTQDTPPLPKADRDALETAILSLAEETDRVLRALDSRTPDPAQRRKAEP